MTELSSDTGLGTRDKELRNRILMERRIPLVLLAMLILSTIGHYVFQDRLAQFIVHHVGGLAVVGLLASLASFIAKKKGRDYRRAFALSVALPYTLGAIAVIVVYFSAHIVYCGGGIILAAALAMIITYSCLRKKKGVETN